MKVSKSPDNNFRTCIFRTTQKRKYIFDQFDSLKQRQKKIHKMILEKVTKTTKSHGEKFAENNKKMLKKKN